MSGEAQKQARAMAGTITEALGGRGIFGVELFVKGSDVIFSEVSPRPHDTGMVTLISQNLSEFALHARAILGLPVPAVRQHGPAASSVILVEGDSAQVSFGNLRQALAMPDTQLRLFGKPEVKGLSEVQPSVPSRPGNFPRSGRDCLLRGNWLRPPLVRVVSKGR